MKKICSGKCSSKVKANNHSKSTNEVAVLFIKTETKSLQLSWKRTSNRYFPKKAAVQILTLLVAAYWKKNESCIGNFDKENIK